VNSAADVWDSVLEILSNELTSTAISAWFGGCKVVDIGANRITLSASSPFKREIIDSRYKNLIKKALRELFSCDFDVMLIDETPGAATVSPPQSGAGISPYDDNEEFTFERFVVGNSNKFAHAAALGISGGKHKDYNPLFIHGNSGLGKTHLLHAIRHALKKTHPEYNIISLTGEFFTNELIHALQIGKNMTEFREKYRGADIFMIDDVQFIAGKVAIQEEVFNTFNTLHAADSQIVLTSDRPPLEMPRLEDRLANRFASGIIADISPPDFEMRVAIIRNKALRLGTILPDDIITYIAENLTHNVRQIEGAVKSIVAYHELMDDNITVNSTAAIIKDLYKGNDTFALNADLIIEETSKYYSLSPADLKGKRRTRSIAFARHVSMYIIRQLTALSLKDIAEIYDGRDHTTALASITRIEDDIKTSEQLAQSIRDIIANINAKT
jgi:chromosomal replication initiator protein